MTLFFWKKSVHFFFWKEGKYEQRYDLNDSSFFSEWVLFSNIYLQHEACVGWSSFFKIKHHHSQNDNIPVLKIRRLLKILEQVIEKNNLFVDDLESISKDDATQSVFKAFLEFCQCGWRMTNYQYWWLAVFHFRSLPWLWPWDLHYGGWFKRRRSTGIHRPTTLWSRKKRLCTPKMKEKKRISLQYYISIWFKNLNDIPRHIVTFTNVYYRVIYI